MKKPQKKTKNINSSLQHMTYQTIEINKDFFDVNMTDVEIITIVRNPYERIISDLFWYGKITINSTKEEVFNTIQYKNICTMKH